MDELQKNEAVEAAATEEPAEVQGQEQTGTPAQEKKYTDEDVNKIIARKIAAERKRMSKLFNEEQQESEIEKRERAVLLRELKADAKDALIEQGLPSSLSGLLSYGSKEEMEQSMKEIGTLFREAVQQAVTDRLRGPVPTRGYPPFSSSPEKALHQAFEPKAR